MIEVSTSWKSWISISWNLTSWSIPKLEESKRTWSFQIFGASLSLRYNGQSNKYFLVIEVVGNKKLWTHNSRRWLRWLTLKFKTKPVVKLKQFGPLVYSNVNWIDVLIHLDHQIKITDWEKTNEITYLGYIYLEKILYSKLIHF